MIMMPVLSETDVRIEQREDRRALHFEYRRYRLRVEVGPAHRLALYVNDCLRKERIGTSSETLYAFTNLELEWEEHHFIELRWQPNSSPKSADGKRELVATMNGAPFFQIAINAP